MNDSAPLDAIWLVGCGNMAGAMLEGWLNAGADPASFTVIRPSGRPVARGVRVVTAPPAGLAPPLVLLGVKPKQLDEAAAAISPALGHETMLVSILAGVEHRSLCRRFPDAQAILRAMPNLPVRLNRGVIGLFTENTPETAIDRASRLLEPLGLVERFDDEGLFELVTALGGSAPAWFYRFADALALAAEKEGLAPEQARRLSRAALAGAAELLATSGLEGSDLVEQVASPGGTTRAGLDQLDPVLPDLMERTFGAAVRRARELAAAAR